MANGDPPVDGDAGDIQRARVWARYAELRAQEAHDLTWLRQQREWPAVRQHLDERLRDEERRREAAEREARDARQAEEHARDAEADAERDRAVEEARNELAVEQARNTARGEGEQHGREEADRQHDRQSNALWRGVFIGAVVLAFVAVLGTAAFFIGGRFLNDGSSNDYVVEER